MSKKEGSADLVGGELGAVNASGFPLQLAVMHAVKNVPASADCKILYVEHAWRSEAADESGFIDLVVSKHDYFRFVIECKRVRDTAWYFLSESGDVEDLPTVFMMKTGQLRVPNPNGPTISKWISAWGKWKAQPLCVEALFCAVRGQSESSATRQPLVERIGGELCSAVEALAKAEEQFVSTISYPGHAFYVPVIVTTAELKVVESDPASISLSNGEVAGGHIETVPYVKLTKQLSVDIESQGPDPRSRRSYTEARLRTIYVVNAEHVMEFLGEFEILRDIYESKWPL